MSDPVGELLDSLRERKWRVVTTDRPMPVPASVVERFGEVPADYAMFLERVATCVSPDETVWFLTSEEFHGHAASAFKWNDFELQSLEAAAGDSPWMEEVQAFWSKHLPILISVKSGYAYLALKVDDGTIVHGREPEYEDVELVSDSFAAFCRTLTKGPARLPEVVAQMLA